MSLKKSLRTIFACVVLELGLLAGCPMPPERIKELMQLMNQPKLAHILPDERHGQPTRRLTALDVAEVLATVEPRIKHLLDRRGLGQGSGGGPGPRCGASHAG